MKNHGSKRSKILTNKITIKLFALWLLLLSSVVLAAPTSGTTEISYAYDAMGNRVSQQNPNVPLIDIDADGMLDTWEVSHFGNLARDGSQDYDNDGFTDLEEYINETNPLVANTTGGGSAISLLSHGDFETGELGGEFKKLHAATLLSFETSNPLSGTRSLKSTISNYKYIRYLHSDFSEIGTRLSNVHLSGLIKTDSPINVIVTVNYEGNKYAERSELSTVISDTSNIISLDIDLAPHDKPENADKDITQISVFFRAGGGVINFVIDDIQLDVIPEGGGNSTDTDVDGMLDTWEVTHFGNLARDGSQDYDNDGLTDLAEFVAATNPILIDTDGDGVSDGFEVNNGMDPLSSMYGEQDTDNDGLPDAFEVFHGLNINNVSDVLTDADTDGFNVWQEYKARTSDNNATEKPTGTYLGFENNTLDTFYWAPQAAGKWVVNSSRNYQGNFSARSGALTGNQTSTFETTINATGEAVSFYSSIGSSTGFDTLAFYIDDVIQLTDTGETAYKYNEYVLSAGKHKLTWVYTNSSGVNSFAWLDNVYLPGLSDSDIDGILDGWEYHYFNELNHDMLLDSDGDGVSDLDEYTNQTDPIAFNELGPPPVITSFPVLSATVGELYSYQLSVDNSAGASYAIYMSPDNMSISASGLVTWTPDPTHEGTMSFVDIIVTTANGSDRQNFDISVVGIPMLLPPVITSSPITTATVDALYSYQLSVDNAMGASYNFNVSPSAMNISASGLITWTPLSGEEGTHSVEVTVITVDGSDTQNFDITVAGVPVLLPPVITSSPITTATVDALYSYQLSVDNAMGASYNFNVSPSAMNISASGLITWTPLSGEEGTHSVEVTVITADGSDTQNFDITVAGIPVLLPPVITSSPITTATVDALYSYQLSVDNAMGASYNFNVSPSAMNISASGLITWTPLSGEEGTHSVEVTVITVDGSDTQNFDITVAGVPVLLPPVITSSPITTATVDALYSYQLSVDNAMGASYNFNVSPSAMNISASGLITWTPLSGEEGTHSVEVTVITADGSDTQNFDITVAGIPVLLPPVITSSPITTATVDALYSYQLSVDNAMGASYNFDVSPSAMNISASGLITWTPLSGEEGTHSVEVTVITADGSDTQNFDITVAGIPVLLPPVITSSPITTATVDALYSYQLSVDNAMGASYNFDVSPSAMNISASGLITWTPMLTDEGMHSVGVTVITADGSDTQNFDITVAGVPVLLPPVITSSPITTATVDTLYSYPLIVDNAMGASYNFNVSPSAMNISASGLITWTPLSGEEGTHSVEVTVTTADGSDTQSFDIIVANGAISLLSHGDFETGELGEEFKKIHAETLLSFETSNPLNGTRSLKSTILSYGYIRYVHNDFSEIGARLSNIHLTGLIKTSSPISVYITVNYEGNLYAERSEIKTVVSDIVNITSLDINLAPHDKPANLDKDIKSIYVLFRAGGGSIDFVIDDIQLNVVLPPVITSSPITTATVDALYSYQLSVDNAMGASYNFNVSPSAMNISASGLITWTPMLTDEGMHSVGVTVITADGSDTQNFDISVVGIPVLLPPVITSSPVLTARVNEPYNYQLSVDNSIDASYNFDVSPSGMNISTSGLVTWTPLSGEEGTHSVEVTVITAEGSDTQSFNVTVANSAISLLSHGDFETGELGEEFKKLHAATLLSFETSNPLNGTRSLKSTILSYGYIRYVHNDFSEIGARLSNIHLTGLIKTSSPISVYITVNYEGNLYAERSEIKTVVSDIVNITSLDINLAPHDKPANLDKDIKSIYVLFRAGGGSIDFVIDDIQLDVVIKE